MALFSELAQEYFERLKQSQTPVLEFESILKEINNLVYSSSKKSLSNEDKAKLVSQIIAKLESLHTKYFSATGPERIFEQQEIVKAFSNENYLDLIEYIKARTK